LFNPLLFARKLLESDLFPYRAVDSINTRAALVLAPHPDDEVFGCGGAIAGHIRAGTPVDLVILTDGAQYGDPMVRMKESRAAAKILGCGAPDFWLLADRQLHYSEALVRRLVDRIALREADLVYAPSPWEVHPDHRHTSMLAMEAVKRSGYPVRLAFYEVGAPLRPNMLLDISPYVDIKRQAMLCFQSQLAHQDYSRHVQALNIYRTYTLKDTIRSAEAFWLLSAAELARESMSQMLTVISPGILCDSTVVDRALMPLVSVLIRSIDRPFLAAALDSIALQTYPNIEVVVVAATLAHSSLPSRVGPFKVRLHQPERPLPRSLAANVAMALAQGGLLLFLDDDDWLMPGHIARLADVMIKQPQVQSVYTGISLVDNEGRPNGQVFDLPFDATRQLAGNLTPIHAVLFRSSVLQLGVQFDEALDRYEDWDFWLQLARLAPMVHLPGVSGAYRLHDSSGVHEGSGPASTASHLLYRKHELSWSDDQLTSVMNRVWAFADLETQLLNMETQLLHAQSTAKDGKDQLELAMQTIANHAANIDSLLQSTSWRITQPLRSLSFWLQRHPIRRLWHRLPRLREILAEEGWHGIAYRILLAIEPLRHSNPNYEVWARNFDTPSPAELKQWQNNITQWPLMPLISVLMPVYNPPLGLLQAAVASVQAQIYPRWELCIADDASSDPGVWPQLQKMSAQDPRIKVMRRSENGHISNASNSALALVNGEFVALMDNDDLLPPDALYWVVEAVNRAPSVQVLYSDEDRLDAQGHRFGAYFKPDWNYTLFLGQNLISHLGIYRTNLLREVGGFRPGLEGSQDYDLALRCIERLKPADILHIPKVLYHWRAVEGSTALTMGAKPYATLAAQRALQEHRARIGKPARFDILPTSNYSCLRLGPSIDVRISVVLVSPPGTRNYPPATWTDKPDYRVLEVFSCSGSDVPSINDAFKKSRGEVVALVRADLTPVNAESLSALIRHAMEDETGLAGGTVRNAVGALVTGGLVLHPDKIASVLFHNLPHGHSGYMGRGALDQELSALSLDCVAMRREVAQLCGGLDEDLGLSLPGCVVFCLRLGEHNLRRIWCPEAVWMEHAGKIPTVRKQTAQHRELFLRRFGLRFAPLLQRDPFYHPALDAARANFSLKALD